LNKEQGTRNKEHYTSLVEGKLKRRIGGIQNRYSYNYVMNNPSVKKYFLPFLDRQIGSSDVVLDYGCGAGVLLQIISSFCKEVHGFDVVPAFIDVAKESLNKECIKNAFAYNYDEFSTEFQENCFDTVIINDVLHHMENPLDAIQNAFKFLKPEGKLIIIEPNILSPAMLISQVFDPNEHKWLKMGYFEYYRKICEKKFEIIEKGFFPVVYGQSSKLVLAITVEMWERFPFGLLRWGNPRLYLVCKVNK